MKCLKKYHIVCSLIKIIEYVFLWQIIIDLGCSHWAAAFGGFLATFGEIFVFLDF